MGTVQVWFRSVLSVLLTRKKFFVCYMATYVSAYVQQSALSISNFEVFIPYIFDSQTFEEKTFKMHKISKLFKFKNEMHFKNIVTN